MTEEEVKKLARTLIQEIREERHDFWIDGELHYTEHMKIRPLTSEDILALREAAAAFRAVRGTWLRIGFFFVMFGAAVVVIFSALGKIKFNF